MDIDRSKHNLDSLPNHSAQDIARSSKTPQVRRVEVIEELRTECFCKGFVSISQVELVEVQQHRIREFPSRCCDEVLCCTRVVKCDEGALESGDLMEHDRDTLPKGSFLLSLHGGGVVGT